MTKEKKSEGRNGEEGRRWGGGGGGTSQCLKCQYNSSSKSVYVEDHLLVTIPLRSLHPPNSPPFLSRIFLVSISLIDSPVSSKRSQAFRNRPFVSRERPSSAHYRKTSCRLQRERFLGFPVQ